MRTLRAIALCLVLLATCGMAPAATFCVATVADLRLALTTAANNAQDDVIHVVRGTYHLGGALLSFNSSEAFGINIAGGYSTGCATRITNAALSVIDGDNSSAIFNVTTSNDFELHFLTLQHALRSGSSGGAVEVSGNGSTSRVQIVNNIVVDNAGDFGIGGMYVSAATILMQNNLLARNSGPNCNFALYADTLHLVNNTISANALTNTSNPDRDTVCISTFSGNNVSLDGSNNILWANSSPNDLEFPAFYGMVLTDNDYQHVSGTPAPGSIGNVSVDPQFAGTGNFRLLPTSPLLGTGSLAPPGGLTTFDLEGNARVYSSRVDLGAYERGDEIFLSGFDK